MAVQLPISAQQTKGILMEIIHVIESQENRMILQQFHDTSDNDAVTLAQNAFPFITKIQQDVIGRYGFPPNERGLLDFMRCVRHYEQDGDIAGMFFRIKSYSIPPPPLREQQLT